MPSILFVCTANRFRSPVAAAILRKLFEEEHPATNPWRVGSAGTWTAPGQPVIPAVLEVARKLGVDLATHRSLPVSGALLSEYDLILVMQASHKEALRSEFPDLNEHVHLFSFVVERGSYDIPDTFGSKQEVEEICMELNELIRQGLPSIRALADALYHRHHGMS